MSKISKSYDVDVVKMIRNNNMVTNAVDEAKIGDTYFMLDYFDLLFHKTLKGDEKVYSKFWSIEEESDDVIAYKAAYKTLSLYAEEGKGTKDIWKRKLDEFSDTPFLGIVQINIVYHVYKQELMIEEILQFLEDEISKRIFMGDNKDTKIKYRLYRSSTSSDFTLIIKGNDIRTIYKNSIIINNMIVEHKENIFNFNTYTNIGIECAWNKQQGFCTFSNDLIKMNNYCRFALRFTASDEFARKKYEDIQSKKECYLTGHMDGLFGRYDFMINFTMEEFAQIFPTLCKSKLFGRKEGKTKEKAKSLTELLCQGIENADIQIINERALVSLQDIGVNENRAPHNYVKKLDALKKDEENLRNVVMNVSRELNKNMKDFLKMEVEFIEERRAFIDITRELREVINTYVPQGMDHDSHVNWQILISDLRVIFECIKCWKKSYDDIKEENNKKYEREQFLGDLRLATEAVNQYYKFIQNVNAQTWQAPLYEIQTQLDAEKMMIAYREFLYEYFCGYNELYKGRPMFYPIIYPDMSIDTASVIAPFKRRERQQRKLLVCKVPSFEYYGRVFDMVPWMLHEASHSLRTMDRRERNEYLMNKIISVVFEQALYKVMNKYTNDYGYHKLGTLEKRVVKVLADECIEQFKQYKESNDCDIYTFQTLLNEYLFNYFDKEDNSLEKSEDSKKQKAIHAEMCKYFAELNLNGKNSFDEIKSYLEDDDKMDEALASIYSAFYQKIWDDSPEDEQWVILKIDPAFLEERLDKQIRMIAEQREVDEYQIKAFCFRIREINRFYSTWYKKGEDKKEKNDVEEVWKKGIDKARKEIEIGFKNNEGFTEIYRILNVVFGSGNIRDKRCILHASNIFNIITSDTVYDLTTREISIYRETCADIYMAATLGLNAFGYCRQVFQTTSDISVENNMRWEEGINVHRFRTVIATLLSFESMEGDNECEYGIISASKLCQDGLEYCHSTLRCLEKKMISKYEGGKEGQKRKGLVEDFIELIKANIDELFKSLEYGETTEILRYSVLAMYAKNDLVILSDIPEARDDVQVIKEKYKDIENGLEEYRHILYRIQYYIYSLAIIAKKKKIYVEPDELAHMRKLYGEYKVNCCLEDDNKKYLVVAEFFNNPETAEKMSTQSMLDETIRFVEEYYYRNRFKIMSSKEIKEEVIRVERK